MLEKSLWMPGSQKDEQMDLKAIKHEMSQGGKNNKTETLLFWAHREKVRFFEKEDNAGENRRQQKRGIPSTVDGLKTKCYVD